MTVLTDAPKTQNISTQLSCKTPIVSQGEILRFGRSVRCCNKTSECTFNELLTSIVWRTQGGKGLVIWNNFTGLIKPVSLPTLESLCLFIKTSENKHYVSLRGITSVCVLDLSNRNRSVTSDQIQLITNTRLLNVSSQQHCFPSS